MRLSECVGGGSGGNGDSAAPLSTWFSTLPESVGENSEKITEGGSWIATEEEWWKPTQSHWRRPEAHAGADLVAADADVVDQLALGQKPCRWRRQVYSITGRSLLLLSCLHSCPLSV